MWRLLVVSLLFLSLLSLAGCTELRTLVTTTSEVGTEIGQQMNENVDTIRSGLEELARIGGVE